jgi:NADH:ubiquinone oxidoreductase subunit C
MEEEGSQLVLSEPRPTIDLIPVRDVLAKKLAGRANVSVLHDMLVVDVDRERLIDVATIVRDDPATRCDLYSVNAGVDTGGELRSVTFVRGTTTHVFVMLRTSCTELDPVVPSLSSVWPGANWCERETYDMFGIVFHGHPDLRRIFLEESFPGHPLRKSFLPPRSDARGG